MGSSPSWGSIFEKSMVRPSKRAGVPVLKRRTEKPRSISDEVSIVAATRPCGPPSQECCPMIIRLFRYTPVHITAARQFISMPVAVLTPRTRPLSVSISAASPCLRSSPSCLSTASSMRFL